MGLIYKITNNINKKIYIGKTIRSIDIRLNEHYNEAKTKKSLSPFHQALLQYKKENFLIEILEDNIPIEKLNQKEQYYISLYHSTDPKIGYNILPGGDGGLTHSKLTNIEVQQIIQILKDDNNLLSFKEIGDLFNISSSVIQSINMGKSWYQFNLNYPLRKYSTTGLTIPKNIYQNIIRDLQESNQSLKEIQNKYNISEQQITAINQGYNCYNGNHNYYKTVYDGPFPIRQTNKKQITKDFFLIILKEYLFSNQSLLQITNKYQLSNSSLVFILQGKRRRELTKDFILPIQQHKQENQKIFKEKYFNLLEKEEYNSYEICGNYKK